MMYQYPIMTISDRKYQTRERLPIADLQKTFKETWNLNDTWSLNFSVMEKPQFSNALALIKPENIITYQGQEFIIKQPNREILNGLGTYTITAVHRYYEDARNVRRDDVSNGVITWSFQDAVNSFINNNDQNISVSFSGDFPKIQIENLGNCSFVKFVQDYFDKFNAVIIPDNKHWNIYSYDTFKKQNGKRIVYQNSAEDLKLNLDSTNIVNQCRCLGKPIDNTNPQKYSVDFIWSDQNSINQWGLQRGDVQSDERFTDQNSMAQFENSNLPTEPVVTLEVNSFNRDNYDKGEELTLIVPSINWSTKVVLNHYERNPFNEIDTPVLQFDNTNIAINDVNVALNDKIVSLQNSSSSLLSVSSIPVQPNVPVDTKITQRLDNGSITLDLNGNIVYVALSIAQLTNGVTITTVPKKYVPKQEAHGTFFVNSDKVYIVAYNVDNNGSMIISGINTLNGDNVQNIVNEDQSNINCSFNYMI